MIGGAGLDVTDPEPLPPDHPLWSLPELHHHAARRQHARDGRAAAVRAHHAPTCAASAPTRSCSASSTSTPATDAAPLASALISHYDVLGVPTTASAIEIREAYRRAARRLHPDQAARSGAPAGASTAMADVNEAYRVLRDPARRRSTTPSLRGRSSAVPPPGRPTGGRVGADTPGIRPGGTGPLPMEAGAGDGGARHHRRAHRRRAGAPGTAGAPPDNILQTGSCVAIEYTGDAREVNCTGHGDLVVRTIVPFDQACPVRHVGTPRPPGPRQRVRRAGPAPR